MCRKGTSGKEFTSSATLQDGRCNTFFFLTSVSTISMGETDDLPIIEGLEDKGKQLRVLVGRFGMFSRLVGRFDMSFFEVSPSNDMIVIKAEGTGIKVGEFQRRI